MNRVIFVLLLLAVIGGLQCDTHIDEGAVSGIWSMFDSPYIIDGDISINDGEILEIQPGVEIIFSDNYNLNVSGQLIAAGTIVDSVYWTVADTTGFSDVSIPDGGWGGIRFDYLCDANEMSELSYCVVEYGKAVGELNIDVTGGAVCVDSCSNVVISNNNISNNLASWGAAIACINAASPVIEFNTMRNNSTYHSGNRNGCGGGVFCNDNSSPIIEGNLIADNVSEDNGGGICAFYGAAPQILNNIIRNNTTEEGGGIIFGTSGMGTISGNIITGNTASFDGGGLCFSGSYNAVVEHNYLAENSSNWGGGMSFFKSANINVTDNVIENNLAILGGGISDEAESNSGIYLSGNSVRNNEASVYGGGISWVSGGLEIDNDNLNSIYENSAKLGDDLYLNYYNEVVYLDTFTVMIPTSAYAYPINALSFEIMNSIYTQINEDIYVSPEGDNSNSGTSADEPLQTLDQALRLIYPGESELTIHLAEGIYSNQTNGEEFPAVGINNVNIAGAGAGETILDAENGNTVFYLYDIDTATVSDLTVQNASAAGYVNFWPMYRGGMQIRNSELRLENMIICDNDGGTVGGGLNVQDSSVCYLENVKITGNMAELYAGGIFCSTNSRVNLNKCEVTGNEVTGNWYESGSAICCADSSEVVITNSTLADNTSLNGGSVYIDENSTLRMVNSICRNDTQVEVYIDQNEGFDNPVMIAYSNINDGIAGIYVHNGVIAYWLDGNIDAEPLFIDPENGDYGLIEDSPCVDSGIDWLEWNDEVLVDLQADEYHGEAPDMGCYEYGDVNTDELKIENVKCKISNYPNPFNPETTIAFYVPQAGNVKLTVYNVKGQKVRTLKNEMCDAGEMQVVWDGRNDRDRPVSSGIYLVKLSQGERVISRKVMMIK